MEAIIDSLKKAGKIFYPKTKTKAVYDDNNNRLDNTLTSINDSLSAKEISSTTSGLYMCKTSKVVQMTFQGTPLTNNGTLADISSNKPKLAYIEGICFDSTSGQLVRIRIGNSGTVILRTASGATLNSATLYGSLMYILA